MGTEITVREFGRRLATHGFDGLQLAQLDRGWEAIAVRPGTTVSERGETPKEAMLLLLATAEERRLLDAWKTADAECVA